MRYRGVWGLRPQPGVPPLHPVSRTLFTWEKLYIAVLNQLGDGDEVVRDFPQEKPLTIQTGLLYRASHFTFDSLVTGDCAVEAMQLSGSNRSTFVSQSVRITIFRLTPELQERLDDATVIQGIYSGCPCFLYY